MGEWRPIETSPKDGQRVLVFDPRRGRVMGVEIRQADGEWWRMNKLGPTHWMPLPQPPVTP